MDEGKYEAAAVERGAHHPDLFLPVSRYDGAEYQQRVFPPRRLAGGSGPGSGQPDEDVCELVFAGKRRPDYDDAFAGRRLRRVGIFLAAFKAENGFLSQPAAAARDAVFCGVCERDPVRGDPLRGHADGGRAAGKEQGLRDFLELRGGELFSPPVVFPSGLCHGDHR